MVRQAVQLRATLDNAATLAPADAASHVYLLRLQCTSCRDVSPTPHGVSRDEEVPVPRSRGTAHLVMRCKGCKRDGSLVLVGGEGVVRESGVWSTVVEVEARGMEVVGAEAGGGWRVTSAAAAWSDVDLGEGEWCEWDEAAGVPVAVSDVELRVVRA